MKESKKEKKSAYSELTGFRRAVPIVLLALAVFSALCFILEDTGTLGRGIASLFLGLFSIGGYFIPALLAVHAILYPSDVRRKRTIIRVIFTLVTLVTISAMAHAIKNFGATLAFAPRELYNLGKECNGGGLVGGAVAFAITKLFGTVGLIIIAVLILALYVTYFFASGRAMICRFLSKVLTAISNAFARAERKKEKKRNKIAEKRESKHRRALASEQKSLFDDEFFAADNGMKSLTITELGINEEKSESEIERNLRLQDKVIHTDTVDNTPRRDYSPTADEVYENKSRTFNMDYGTDDSKRTLSKTTDGGVYSPRDNDIVYENNQGYSTDNADAVFGTQFEAFDFKLNQDLSARPKTNTSEAPERNSGINEFAKPIRTLSEEEIEKARQRADFEMKKKAAINAREQYESARAELERVREEKERYAKAEYGSSYTSYADTDSEKTEQEPYIPDYMKEISTPVSEVVTEPMEKEDDRAHDRFESAINSYENEINESLGYTDSSEEASEHEEVKLERSILEPYSDYTETEERSEALGFEIETETEELETLDLSGAPSEDDTPELSEIPEDEQSEEVKELRRMFPILDMNEDNSEEDSEDENEEDSVPFDTEPKRNIFDTYAKSKPEPEKAPVKADTPDYSGYQHPPLDLLIKGKVEEDLNQEDEKNLNAEKLVDALLQFNVRISIKGIDRGPRITRYEIVPARGVKVQQVTNLFNDIALNLGAEGIRMEAPIPGKSAIGVEIPNKKPSVVLLRDLVDTEEFKNSESKTLSCLGKDVTGNPVFADIAKMPHVLVAGATGMGKSVCINSILISILYKARPDEVKLIMIDPKKVEFNGYNGIPHLLIPVVTDVKQAAGALMWAVEQMEKRYDLMEQHEVRKLDAYNEKMRQFPELGKPLPKIIIVIDELNDLMIQVRKPAEDLIMSIAQKARAAGIHLIIGTQRPSVDVITGVIKANIPSRIACKVASYNDSKTILEQAGAEKLLNNGDMLYISSGAPKAVRVQGAFVSDGEVSAIMKFLKSQARGDIYDSQALEEINRAAQKCSKGKGGDDYGDDGDDGDNVGVLNDPQFLDAVELAVKSGKIATSLIQRKISIGYGKAAKFIDIMEEMGIVSEPNGQRPRDVLITKDEWHEMLSRRSLD